MPKTRCPDQIVIRSRLKHVGGIGCYWGCVVRKNEVKIRSSFDNPTVCETTEKLCRVITPLFLRMSFDSEKAVTCGKTRHQIKMSIQWNYPPETVKDRHLRLTLHGRVQGELGSPNLPLPLPQSPNLTNEGSDFSLPLRTSWKQFYCFPQKCFRLSITCRHDKPRVIEKATRILLYRRMSFETSRVMQSGRFTLFCDLFSKPFMVR